MARNEKIITDVLLEKAQNGEREAFSQLVRIMMNKIVALTYKMTGDKDAAKDLAQDTFISAYQNLSSFKGDSKFESWLYRIAVNKSLNYIKRESKTTSDEFVQLETNITPETNMRRKELSLGVRDFMLSLPEQQRVVFELRFYKELTFDEIAQTTGKALGTVKTLYREAVIKLKATAVQKGWQS